MGFSASGKGPKKHISISILWGYPYLIGLPFKGFMWDIRSLIFAYVVFGGPIRVRASDDRGATAALQG